MTVFPDDNLGAAAPDVDYQHPTFREGPAGLHAQVNEPGFFEAGDYFDMAAKHSARALEEVILIGGVAQSAGTDRANRHSVYGPVLLGHRIQHITCEIDGRRT